MPQLRWALCDSQGRLLAPIDQFEQDGLQLGLNDIRTGTVTVSIEDPVVPLVTSMATRLKAWLNGSIILNAPVFLPSHDCSTGGQPGTLAISATDNLRLATAFTRAFAEQLGVDQSEIMALLVEAGDATAVEKAAGVLGHGIIRGSLAASVLRDRTYYDLTNIWEALLNMSQVIDGPDFELEPLDRDDGVFAQLNTYYPKQGTDLSDSVALEYGVGASNASGFGWQPSGEQLCNRFICAGETPEESPTTPAWLSENLESQRLYGIYEGNEVDTEVSEVQTLKEKADNVVATRAFPLDFVTVQPAVQEAGSAEVAFGVPPRFGPHTDPDADFWLGDTIRIIAREGELSKTLTGRAVVATLNTADAAGNVAVAVGFSPPDHAAGVTGEELALTLGPPNQTAGEESTVPTEEPPLPEEGWAPEPEPEPEEFDEPDVGGPGPPGKRRRHKKKFPIGPAIPVG
jgi:hypothetical protein